MSSSDGGATFTAPKNISGNVLYDQGSRPVVGPDGTLYVFWHGSTRLASLNSTWVAKSTDGGATWGKPVQISALTDSDLLVDTAFRDNSFPAAAAAPNGDLYATWTTETDNGSLGGDTGCAPWLGPVGAGCRSYAVYSKSTNGGATWSAPARVFGSADRTAVGYPVSQPGGGTLAAPDPAGAVEDIFPAVATAPNGTVYIGAYRGDVVSPWQTCAAGPPPPEGRINCSVLGPYIHNTRLDYVVTNLTSTRTVSTHPINTRNGFGGGFFGDYTDLSVGSDGTVPRVLDRLEQQADGGLVLRIRVRSDPDQPGGCRHRGRRLLACSASSCNAFVLGDEHRPAADTLGGGPTHRRRDESPRPVSGPAPGSGPASRPQSA